MVDRDWLPMHTYPRLTGPARVTLCGLVLLLAGCGGGSPTASTPTIPTTSRPASGTSTSAERAGTTVRVLYAGSLVNLMEKGIGPAFQRETGTGYQGQGAGSVALATAIKDQTKTADVFISADPTVNGTLSGQANGNWVSWYLLFARTSLVIGFNPSSKFAPDFEKVRDGTLPWYQVLQQPGLKLGRTDPNLDPKGYRTLFLFDLAQDFHRQPDLKLQVLGTDTNTEQIFPEETLESRLETGALDAGIFYLNEAAERNLPFVTLPDEVNQSNPDMAATYARATWTNAKGQSFKGAPIVYTATVLSQAKDPAAAVAFVQYLVSPAGKALMQEHGLLDAPVLFGGDRTTIPAPLQPLLQGEHKG